MANSTIGGQIFGELAELGKKVGGETAKIPKDIAGKALESMGASTSGGKSQKPLPSLSGEGQKAKTAWEQIDGEKERSIKRQMARKALEELSRGDLSKPKEPSIWERLQMEEEQKKRDAATRKAQTSAQTLQVPTSKPKRGNLFGVKQKQTATENRNVRQD